jgi:hypothetical protein
MSVSTVELKYRLRAVIRVAGQDNGNGQCAGAVGQDTSVIRNGGQDYVNGQ